MNEYLDQQTIIVIASLIAGAFLGVLLTLLLNRRRIHDAVLARTRELESALGSQQNIWQLREASLEQDLGYTRAQLEELKRVQLVSDSHRVQSQQELNQARQELAAAREKLDYLSGVQQQLRQSEQALGDMRSESAQLKTHLEQERKHYAEQLELLQNARAELTKDFENIANKIFDSKQQQFSHSSKSLLETTIDPLRLQLTEFRRKVEDVYEKESADRNRLSGQVLELQKQAQKIGEDAVNLAQALKGNNKAQGNWGEIILERLLEQSGLQKGREYDTQVSLTNDEGARGIPDVIIHMPENKDIIIDAKVSLVDYEKYCSSDDDVERARHLTAHTNSLRSHIKNLNLKSYEKMEGVKTLDFVFLFIPIEAAFLLALHHDPRLSVDAYDRRIILVSPTNLLAILRTVENIWRYEKQNKNAERIAKSAGALHDQFVLLLDSLDTVGTHINKTQEAYDLARKRLNSGKGNVLKRVDDLRRLGAKTKKVISRDLVAGTDDADEDYLLEDLDASSEKDLPENDSSENDSTEKNETE